MVYYNEFDPKAAAWLRELMAADQIPAGAVDERSIEDVRPDEIMGYKHAHFFAGIGGWPYALRLARWPDEWPVWTGSCPCQPYSQAGSRTGDDDPRALWWAWRWLIDQCRPAIIFGEQVASKAGREWLSGVRADLEAMGYAVGSADLCAAGVGAPHIRQRLWWVAYTTSGRRQKRVQGQRRLSIACGDGEDGADDGMADAEGQRRNGRQDSAGAPGRSGAQNGSGVAHTTSGRICVRQEAERQAEPARAGEDGGMADADGRFARYRHLQPCREHGQQQEDSEFGFWTDSIWTPCADGKARRIKPGLQPLVNGFPGRVGLLRGYGNAIVPQVAAAFVRSYMEVMLS